MGAVHLTVSELARSVDFWRDAVGLEVLEQGAGRASLGSDGRELLALVEEPGARPAHGFTGLFHVALLVPERPALAAWLAHAGRDRVPLQGLSDHFVSEAIYLGDPDGHGIEIYADRPRASWEGQVERLTTLPLDVDDLLGELDDPETEPFDGLPGRDDRRPRAPPRRRRPAEHRLLPRHARLRPDGDLRRPGRLPRRRRLPPPCRREHVAEPGRAAGPRGHGAPPARDGDPPEGARDELAGRLDAEDTPDGPLVRDPSGNRLLLAAA